MGWSGGGGDEILIHVCPYVEYDQYELKLISFSVRPRCCPSNSLEFNYRAVMNGLQRFKLIHSSSGGFQDSKLRNRIAIQLIAIKSWSLESASHSINTVITIIILFMIIIIIIIIIIIWMIHLRRHK